MFGRTCPVDKALSVNFAMSSYVTDAASSCVLSGLLVEWLVQVVSFGVRINDWSAFVSPHS